METLLGATFVACAILIFVIFGAMVYVIVGAVGTWIRDVILRYTVKKVVDNAVRDPYAEGHEDQQRII
jgi:hypothetical protein